jgi:hypothetical protein
LFPRLHTPLEKSRQAGRVSDDVDDDDEDEDDDEGTCSLFARLTDADADDDDDNNDDDDDGGITSLFARFIGARCVPAAAADTGEDDDGRAPDALRFNDTDADDVEADDDDDGDGADAALARAAAAEADGDGARLERHILTMLSHKSATSAAIAVLRMRLIRMPAPVAFNCVAVTRGKCVWICCSVFSMEVSSCLHHIHTRVVQLSGSSSFCSGIGGQRRARHFHVSTLIT